VTGEPRVRAALQLGPRDRVEEVGVFPQPASIEDATTTRADETWRAAERATEEDLVSIGRERTVSVEPRIQASLPRGRAKRVNDLPGVLVLEDIPPPKLVLGPVAQGSRGAWIADTRRDPAVLLMQDDGRELVFWGEGGKVRLFVVDRLA
jgi:hypothetical protein